MRGLIQATVTALVVGLFGLTCPAASLANIEPPSEDALKSAIRAQIPTYWDVGGVTIVAEVNAGDAVNPAIKQRFEATAQPVASLHLPAETGNGDVLKPFIVLVETVPAGSARTLYGVASSSYRAGAWATEVTLESTVNGTGKPRSMFEGPTLVRGSDEERQAREKLASAERADQEVAASLEALRGTLNVEAARLVADHEAAMGKLRIEQVRAAEAAKAEIAKLQSEHAQAVKDAEAQREANVTAALTIRDERLEGLIAEKDALLKRATDELAAATAKHSSELAALEMKFAAEVEALKRKHAVELEAEKEEVVRLTELAEAAKQRTEALEVYTAEKSRQIEFRDKARLRLLEVAAVRVDEFDEIVRSLPETERQTLVRKALDSDSPALRREVLRSLIKRNMRFDFSIEYFDAEDRGKRTLVSSDLGRYTLFLNDLDNVTGIILVDWRRVPSGTRREIEESAPLTVTENGITLTTQRCAILVPFAKPEVATTAQPQPCNRRGGSPSAYRATLLY